MDDARPLVSARRPGDSRMGAVRNALLDEFSPPPPGRGRVVPVSRLVVMITLLGLLVAGAVVGALVGLLALAAHLR